MLSDYLATKYQAELATVLPELEQARAALATSTSPTVSGIRQEIVDGEVTGNIAGLTPMPDALYLYLLVREYQPKTIFEIGTWVGTSALFMAEALKKNGSGHIYTCDTNHYYLLGEEYADWVTYVPGHSDTVLANFHEQGTTFDFMFIDGNLTSRSRQILAQTTHEQTVFAIHDFLLPDDKGIQVLLRVPKKKQYGLAVPPAAHHPKETVAINQMTAVFLPEAAVPADTALKTGTHLHVYRMFLTVSYSLGKVFRKFRSLVTG
jgi:predicted O-methyltransferase YrrM